MADEIVAHGITREDQRPNAFLRGMAKHPELCFIILSLLVTFLSNYGFSFKSKPLVVPAKPPEPLFPPSLSSSWSVLDLYMGDLQPLLDLLHHEDLLFVMYYAPWCARSHVAAAQFSKAAEFMEGQVEFVAVNCWYPEGQCRKEYKFLFYPVFFAYHKNNDGYRYTGIERAEYMVKFLEDLLHPLKQLHDITDVKDFVIQHDTAVVGYFDFNSSPEPSGFQQFFYASMRVVEHDPYQPVKFGVVTNPVLASLFHMKQPSDLVHLRINNSTLKFPWPNNITSSNIVKWVFAGRHQLPVRWLVPLGMKSLTLSREINKGPAIIMFHRVSPLSTASQSLSVFKDLALRYNQCPGDELKRETSLRWLSLSLRNILSHVQSLQACQHYKEPTSGHSARYKCCISTATRCRGCLSEARFNICEICQHWSASQRGAPAVCSFDSAEGQPQDSTLPSPTDHLPENSCLNSITSYDVSSRTSICCKWCNNKNISYSEFLTAPFYVPSNSTAKPASSRGERRPTDRYVLDSLEKLPRKLCDRLLFQKNQQAFPSAVISDLGRSSVPEEFTGQGCQANHSLTFISMDSRSHWMFAERLGLDVSQAHVLPVIVAVDKQKEEQHVLLEKFSKKNTAMFILNFTRGLLRRELRFLPPARHEGCGSSPSLCVTELTTATLHSALSQPQDVVLLVYAGWCGFCLALSHIFLHLAHYFHTSPDITFARINGETNDLPWEFTMESYPSIIFFPAHREADSVAFPEDVPPSLANLIRFVLQHTSFPTRLRLAADVCSKTCVRENLLLALQALRSLRAKLRRTNTRRNLALLALGGKAPSPYHRAMDTLLAKKMGGLKEDVKEVKALIEVLERSRGRLKLDPGGMERLLQEKLRRRKDLFSTGAGGR